LVSALAEKERLTSVALAATLEIQRLMELNEVSQLDIHRVIGYDGLKNDPKAAANAAKFICNDQVQPADIFLIVDTSMWSDCKEGIAYAVNGVFQKNIFEAHKHCPWQDVDDILPPTAEDPRIQIGNFLIGKDPDNIDAESDELDGLLEIGEKLGAVAFASVELLGGIAFESEFRHCWLKVIASSASDKGWHELGLALRKKEYEAIRALGIDSEGLLIDCLHEVANEYEYMGGSQECASCHQELVNLYREWIPQLEEADEKDEVINGALFSHANILSRLSKPLEAIPLRRRELAWCREKNGDTDPGTLTSINGLAIDLREIGELKEAEALFRELVTARQQILEPDDFQIGRAIGGLAKTLEAAGKLEEALIYSQQALDHRQAHEGPDAWWTNRERLDLARVLQKLGRYREASALLTELQESMSRNTEPDDADRQLITDAEELARSLEKGL
jgi:tetratricopeptide (TPR) repeat protein